MEFRVLGPLEVMAAGQPLELGTPRQRTLLGLLLVHAGEVVSYDRVVEDLWDGDPPATARHTPAELCPPAPPHTRRGRVAADHPPTGLPAQGVDR